MSKLNQIKNASYYLTHITKPYFSKIYENKKIILSLIGIYSVCVYNVNIVHIINSLLFYYLYWFSLGILSTIGLGFGFHTGIFFLFPHVIHTYNTISNQNYLTTLLICLPEIILWGMGSAIGELPPYLITKNSIVTNRIRSKGPIKIFNFYNLIS